ncbi:MAG: class I SAM-dependent methyltransferase [Acidimicrobiia bacterium]
MSQKSVMQGRLWSARAGDWAETLEGPQGWGIPLYKLVLDRADIGPGAAVLDVGCGAGRFVRMAADRGATVAGIDAAEAMVAIARERTPDGDFRLGDMEALPWDAATFDTVTAFSALQFATDTGKALGEAGRVTRKNGRIVVAVPGPPEDSEFTPFMMALQPLMPPPPPGTASRGDPFALSEPRKLEELLRHAGLTPREAGKVDCPMEFVDQETMLAGMLAAGPAVLAIQNVGEEEVRRAAIRSLAPFRSAAGGYRLENTFQYHVATT